MLLINIKVLELLRELHEEQDRIPIYQAITRIYMLLINIKVLELLRELHEEQDRIPIYQAITRIYMLFIVQVLELLRKLQRSRIGSQYTKL